MGSRILDMDRLLEPISAENVGGINLRKESSSTSISIYHTIKDARAKARSIERQGMADDIGQPVVADWKPVLDNGPKILIEKSKDLEVVAWLIESLVRQYSFAGLRSGFELARRLCEKFWDNLYPEPDEIDGASARVAPLTGLNGDEVDGTLIQPINNTPLTASPNLGPYTRSSYRQASDLESVVDPDKKKARIDRGAISMEMFRRAVAETPTEFYVELSADLQGCIAEFDALNTVLEERCGRDSAGRSVAPPTSRIRNALVACDEVLRTEAKDKLASAKPLESAEPGDASTKKGVAKTHAVNGAMANRDEALESLLRIARFFRETEPQSPVSYAIEQVVRWGRMPLPALWSELIPEDAARQSLFKLVGIPAPPEPKA